MFQGGRYDLEAARAAAREAKRRARIKSIASNVFFLVVVASIAVACWIGWKEWSDKKEREREAALEAERQAEAEAKAEAERQAAERKEREAARQKLEEIRSQERKELAEARLNAQLERERIAAEREESRRRAKENEAEQKERKEMLKKTVARVKFSIDDHIVCEHGAADAMEVAVDERRWADLIAAAATSPVEFLDLARGNVTNDFSEANYPSADVVSRILSNLDRESFTMVLRLQPEKTRAKRYVLVGIDADRGVALPVGAREMKDKSGRVTGWTVPFAFGDSVPVFLLTKQCADRISRDWESLRKRIVRESEQLTPDTKDGFVKERLRRELPAFARSVAIEVTTPPPPEPAKADPSKSDSARQNRSDKPSYRLKGLNRDFRSLRGTK